MLGFRLPRWLSSKSQKENDQEGGNLPWPTTQSPSPSYSTPRLVRNISGPIPRSAATSLTGYDNPHIESTPTSSQPWRDSHLRNSSLTHVASSSQASMDVYEAYGANLPKPQPDYGTDNNILDGLPPAVIRIETGAPRPRAAPFRRTVSSPPTSPYHASPTDSAESAEITPTAFGVPSMPSNGGRWNLKVHTDQQTSRSNNNSTHSLPYRSRTQAADQPQAPSMNTDVYGYAYGYPLVKQLSPIVEQDYASPDTLHRSRSLPSTASDKNLRVSASASPGGSQASTEIARPSPAYSSPFISRPLNRTASQNSSRTHVSTSSVTVAKPPSIKAGEKPTIALDTRPNFIGPYQSHPSPSASTPRSRLRFNSSMPMIAGSTEDYNEEDYDYTATNESLHAESFVTATSQEAAGYNYRPRTATSIFEVENAAAPTDADTSATVYGGPGIVRGGGSFRSQKPSASESFIAQRWDRDAALGSGVRTFRVKKQYRTVTPAFWTFWFGFICPFLWLIGGWHFTHFGEQPPRLTFWEFYFNAGYWKEMCCGSRNKKREMMMEVHPYPYREGSGARGKQAESGRLPRWVTEKQEKLYDPKRSLKGISFGYPFIPRHVLNSNADPANQTTLRRFVNSVIDILAKPNRVFDQFYGVKLNDVRGRPESARRCFDPWIQRCRYALCYAVLLLALGLCGASIYLIVYNTGRLE
ncbi:hypothetical protein BKA70DRAFT_1371005 [Coprinopsis sp. MPI-PUGE-AT-0042]|nr:hypothetical protein BKA70DRAFT_1371005 [Coprinopsis sp. MPI-PUGE-AT-0042]